MQASYRYGLAPAIDIQRRRSIRWVYADQLDEAVMAAVAREFNQSETTFLVAPTLEGAEHRLRSFMPAGVEVFGAGHNALGAWWWLAGETSVIRQGHRLGRPSQLQVRLDAGTPVLSGRAVISATGTLRLP